jgi:hypothetical protein
MQEKAGSSHFLKETSVIQLTQFTHGADLLSENPLYVQPSGFSRQTICR